MKCSEVEYLSPLYCSGELDSACRAEVEQHVAGCLACARELEADKKVDALLQSAALAQPVEAGAVEARVRAQIYSAPASAPWRLRWLIPVAGGLAAVFAVVLYFGIARPPVAAPPAPPVAQAPHVSTAPNILADAADDHNEEVVEHFQREWLYGAAQIRKLVSEKAGNPAVVSELAPKGYHVDRARICELGMRNYVHLVYSDGSKEVSFFVREQDGEQIVGPERASSNGEPVYGESFQKLQVAAFQSARYTVVVVSDQPLNATVDFARHAAGSVRENITRGRSAPIIAGVFQLRYAEAAGF